MYVCKLNMNLVRRVCIQYTLSHIIKCHVHNILITENVIYKEEKINALNIYIVGLKIIILPIVTI